MPRHAQRRVRRSAKGTPPPARPTTTRLRWGRLVAAVAALVSVVVLAAVADIFYRAVSTMPNLSSPTNVVGMSSMIYDRKGKLITAVPSPYDRQPVKIGQIPKLLQEAVIATEDRTFYTNPGISIRGIMRALFVDVFTNQGLQGASTITQQLANNLYLTRHDTLTRKLKQAILALELNRRYTKPQILDMYLNEVDLGQHAYGVKAAAQVYFNQTNLSKLSLPQIALLAGLPNAPTALDPIYHPKAALARRNVVLQSMLSQHYITAAQAKAAEAAPLQLQRGPQLAVSSYPDPWYIDAVIQTLESAPYNLSPQQVTYGGLHIYTALHPSVEAAAVAAVKQVLKPFPDTGSNPMQAAEAVINQQNGDVIAIVGGRKHTTAMGFDRALQAQRQPGSAIKPLVDYVPALAAGYTAGTTVDDAVHVYQSPGAPLYVPKDYQLPYYGLTTFDEALRRSVNTVAVQVLHRVGVQTGLRNAQRMGLPLTQKDAHLALALGGTVDCCSPLNMADAYATIANGGLHVTPRIIIKVVGPNGRVLFHNAPHYQRAISPQVAYVMTKMLETDAEPQPNVGWNVISGPYDSNWGTGYDGAVHDNVPGWPTAGKTGTTNGNRDAWFVGYTPLYSAAVWVGYDQPKPTPNLYGGTYAGPIFRATLTAAVRGHPVVHFQRPPGIVQAPIDIKAPAWTVASPSSLTPKAYIRNEWFVAGTQPTKANPLWVQRKVDSRHPSLLWRSGCSGHPVTRTFLNRPRLGPSWAQKIARDLGFSPANWQQFVPLDMQLAPPTHHCGPSNSSGTSTGGAQGCHTSWTVSLGSGGLMRPSIVCLPVRQAAQITFQATDGRVHQIQIVGFGQSATVPSTGQPVTIGFTPQHAGQMSFVTDNGTIAGRIVVQSQATSSSSSSSSSSPTGSTSPASSSTSLSRPSLFGPFFGGGKGG